MVPLKPRDRVKKRSTGETGAVWIQEPDGLVWIIFDNGSIDGAEPDDVEKIEPDQKTA